MPDACIRPTTPPQNSKIGRGPAIPPLTLATTHSRDLTRFVIPDGGVFQDFSLVLVPGRSAGLPGARWSAKRAALRAHRRESGPLSCRACEAEPPASEKQD